MKDLVLITKGIVIGIANVIPGVSGGTLAVSLGIYDKIIDNIHAVVFKQGVRSGAVFYLSKLALGALLGIYVFSRVVVFLLEHHRQTTVSFFIGLILGGLRVLFRHVDMAISIRRLMTFAGGIVIVMLLGRLPLILGQNQGPEFGSGAGWMIWLFLCGIMAGGAMILPGISGSMLLMVLGVYGPIQRAIADLALVPLSILGVGVVLGAVLSSLIVKGFLERWPACTHWFLFGLAIGSVCIIIPPLPHTPVEWIWFCFIFVFGFVLAIAIERKGD